MEVLTAADLPERIADEDALDELMSRPSGALVEELGRLDGDLLVLGVAGKIGPLLARMAKRAAPGKRVIGVARFSDPRVKAKLEGWGIETIAADLLDRAAVEALPKPANVVYMAGRKFGTVDDPPFAWAMNALVPGIVAEAFRGSRIVAFSTLCVYPFAPVLGPGCDESVPPTPVGEYANGCAARERIFQYSSQKHGTPGRLIRLNYAIDLRYGVLFDVAAWVRDRTPIPLATGHANVIWQGDAIDQIVRALGHCTTPASPLNIGGPGHTSIRWLAREFGRRFGIEPVFEGTEAETAWVNDTGLSQRLFGYPLVPLARMIDWTVDWLERGGPRYAKPTRYEVRDGRF